VTSAVVCQWLYAARAMPQVFDTSRKLATQGWSFTMHASMLEVRALLLTSLHLACCTQPKSSSSLCLGGLHHKHHSVQQSHTGPSCDFAAAPCRSTMKVGSMGLTAAAPWSTFSAAAYHAGTPGYAVPSSPAHPCIGSCYSCTPGFTTDLSLPWAAEYRDLLAKGGRKEEKKHQVIHNADGSTTVTDLVSVDVSTPAKASTAAGTTGSSQLCSAT
jgi:hypothetical protein